jgi:hypothetical protein
LSALALRFLVAQRLTAGGFKMFAAAPQVADPAPSDLAMIRKAERKALRRQ